ncbi:MAG: copper-translocating P-type ATPase [Blastopirellula sp.]|nr:MAG: copper-translocating P-type ATPase [Blastopirellula sp.]
MKKIEIPVFGMTCERCVQAVTDELRSVPSVKQVEVSLADKNAIITAAENVDQERLTAAVLQAGFTTIEPAPSSPNLVQLPTLGTSPAVIDEPSKQEPVQQIVLDVSGMHCASCSLRVESALQNVKGVESAVVNLATNQAKVQFDTEQSIADELIRAVSQSGYEATLADNNIHRRKRFIEQQQQEKRSWAIRCIVAIVALILLLLMRFVPTAQLSLAGMSSLIIALIVQVYVGWPYYQGAYKRAIHLSSNMDTLVALGTSVAFLNGVYQVIQGSHSLMAFMDSTMILGFISIGRYLEIYAKGKASSSILSLLDLAPQECMVTRGDQTMVVSVQDVRKDETIIIRPGDKIPLDCKIVDGSTEIDQSWITGEAVPVFKQAGDQLTAGTINGSHAVSAEVTAAAGQGTLDRIVELVEQAQASKAEIQITADKVVAWFVPCVLVIAITTLLTWGFISTNNTPWPDAVQYCIAVLVIACPCAMGLATPSAILVASGMAARKGIVVKNAVALERVGQVDQIVLDKTGTITRGQLLVKSVVQFDDRPLAELLSLVASIQATSSHPIAQAIVQYAKENEVEFTSESSTQAIPGKGILANVSGRSIALGNAALLNQIDEKLIDAIKRIEYEADPIETVIYICEDKTLIGLIALYDEPTEHAKSSVAALKELGITPVMITGDQTSVANSVAALVGIDDVFAEVLPEEKVKHVMRLQAPGHLVAMVGDGINDAAALAVADCGIAIGAGADIAIESADAVLMHHDLRDVVYLIRLSRRTLRVIYQNLFWAFGYNIALIPLAAGLLMPIWDISIPPYAAAFAMAASSLTVVGNSLRIGRFLPIDKT